MKKLLILVAVMLLCMPFAMAQEAAVIDFEDGSAGPFGQSGSCSMAVRSEVAHSGSKALAVTGRSGNNWDAADLLCQKAGIGLGDQVTLTAWVYVDSDEEGTFVIAKSAADYGWLANAAIPGKTWTEMKATFTLEDDVNIRFQNYGDNWNSVNYYIDDVLVEVSKAPAEEESNEPPVEYASDFSAGTDGWYARSAGGAEVSVTDEGGLLITGRSATWNSPGRDFPLVTGKTYTLSVLVKQDQVDSTGFILSIAHTRDDVESYENLATCTAKKGEWTLMQCTYIAGRNDKYVFYVEGGAADTEYQIKDFSCAEQTMAYGKAGIASLKEVYAPYFDFGTAVTGNEVLDAERMDFYASQFNIFTPGNEMKPDALLNVGESIKAVKKTADQTAVKVKFDSCIPLLDWAKENGVKLHGHVLVWHSQTPQMFFHEGYSIKNPVVSREVMLARMENYIKQVLQWTEENYPGVIVSWDVVNEAVADGSNKLRDSLWTQVVGEDFVNRAFEYARKYAAEGVLLYYNDYNSENTMKNLGIRRLLESLIAEGNIDGYGFQSHYSAGSTSMFYVEVAWKEVAKLRLNDGTPIRLRVSELDVGIPSNTDGNWQTQARFYDTLLQLYLQYADQIEAVHTWGTVDDLSWRADEYPLLFDAMTQPKPAFYAIVD